jgi:hypothetical protein
MSDLRLKEETNKLNMNNQKYMNPNLPLIPLRRQKVKTKKKHKSKKPQQKRSAPRVRFSETDIALELRLNAPLEYDFIIEAGGYEPLPEFIEQIGYTSLNPYFKSVRFRKTLMTYRKQGCRQWRKTSPPSSQMIRERMRVRKKKMRI